MNTIRDIFGSSLSLEEAMRFTISDSLTDKDQRQMRSSITGRTDKQKVKAYINGVLSALPEFAGAMYMMDTMQGSTFLGNGISLSVPDSILDGAEEDQIVAFELSIDNLIKNIIKFRADLDTFSGGSEDMYPDATSFIKSSDTGALAVLESGLTQIKNVLNPTNEFTEFKNIDLDPIQSLFITNLPKNIYDTVLSTLSAVGTKVPVEVAPGGQILTPGYQFPLPSSILQHYYRMVSVLVTKPIVTRPNLFSTELVDRILVSKLAINNNDIIQYYNMDDEVIQCDNVELDNQKVRDIATLFTTRESDASKVITTSTEILTMGLERFAIDVEREKFRRTVLLQKIALNKDVDGQVQKFVMEKIQWITVASGDVTQTVESGDEGADAAVFFLTGINSTGGKNGTASEQDFATIVSAIDHGDGAQAITHALVYPAAIATLFNDYSDSRNEPLHMHVPGANFWNPTFGGNREQFMNQFNLKGISRGAGLNPEFMNQGFGWNGLIDPNGPIPQLINGLDPTTSEVHKELAMWKRFKIVISGYIEITIVPYAEAPIYFNGVQVNDTIKNHSMAVVNGKCSTDIFLLNKDRTALLLTTGPEMHIAPMTKISGTSLQSGFSETWRIWMKPHAVAYTIKSVAIARNYYQVGITIIN